MLPPSYLDQMPDAFVKLAQQVEDEILQDVARRIAKMDGITSTANWQLWRYQQTEAVREDVVKLLAKYSGKSEATIRRLLKEAATEAMEREDSIYYHYGLDPTPFEESAALNNLLTAGARQTCGTWQNLTATTANTVTGAFERTLDVAWGKVATGAFDYKTAIKQAVDSLADDLPAVTYPSGHTDSLEVAARRAVLTGVNQTAGKLQEARMDEMGAEFVETSAHGGARPSHAEWQGKQFHRGGAVDYLGKHYPDFGKSTGYGTGAGLCGWNCRHSFFSIFPELGDPPTWTQEELEALNARNIECNGKMYTQYEINQMQRARERNVRKWKKRYLAETTTGALDKEDITKTAVRLRAAREELKHFVSATGGRLDSSRTSTAKFGRSEASKASAQSVRHFNDWSSSIGLRSPESLAEYYDIKYNKKEQWTVLRRDIDTLTDISKKDWTDEFKAKAVDTFYGFKSAGVEISDHGVARFLSRHNGGKGFEPFTVDDIVQQLRNPPNYLQEDGREIRFYSGRAIISNEDGVIVSIVLRKNAKADWREYIESSE